LYTYIQYTVYVRERKQWISNSNPNNIPFKEIKRREWRISGSYLPSVEIEGKESRGYLVSFSYRKISEIGSIYVETRYSHLQV
jgi:hypothetical protein